MQKIQVGEEILFGELRIPSQAVGVVIFAHGSGSSRLSPRNQFVSSYLETRGMGTLLFDLLTEQEEQIDALTAEVRFDIPLLALRLLQVTAWLESRCNLSLGYFGANTGAAAALVAAAQKGSSIRAVVSRGGRPDLAKEALPRVFSSTLLIVGGFDGQVIEMNQEAFRLMSCEKKLEIVAGATHLFEEAGALEKVAELAALWFESHFIAPRGED